MISYLFYLFSVNLILVLLTFGYFVFLLIYLINFFLLLSNACRLLLLLISIFSLLDTFSLELPTPKMPNRFSGE